jgi:hypothetical protein
MGFAWNQYRHSYMWGIRKGIALERAGYRCECGTGDSRCNRTTQLEMHHDRYPEYPDSDTVTNVRILCRDCHENFHHCFPERASKYISTDEMWKKGLLAANHCNHTTTMPQCDVDALIKNMELKKNV